MKIDETASLDVTTVGGGETPPRNGLASIAPPEIRSLKAKNSQTGVSTKNALSANEKPTDNQKDSLHWYALRTTYGREKKAYDYMVSKGVTAFLPTINSVKLINGKRKEVTESRLPNIFFAYGTEDQIKTYVYDNVNLPFLRFYYRHEHICGKTEKSPMIIPNNQMESLKIICEAEAEDIIISGTDIPKFETGQMVRVVEGQFKGVIGQVARYQGQQRVGVTIDGLLTIATTYIPTAFLKKIG